MVWLAFLMILRRSHTTGMQSKVHPTYKTKYRVANWPTYNQALAGVSPRVVATRLGSIRCRRPGSIIRTSAGSANERDQARGAVVERTLAGRERVVLQLWPTAAGNLKRS